jgi:hypothetical protein
VGAEPRVGGRDLEAALVQVRIHLDRPLEMANAVTQAIELLDFDMSKRGEPARIGGAKLLTAIDDGAERTRVRHGGKEKTLEEVVPLMAKLQLDIQLEPEEVDAIIAFLKSLTGPLPSDVAK